MNFDFSAVSRLQSLLAFRYSWFNKFASVNGGTGRVKTYGTESTCGLESVNSRKYTQLPLPAT